MNEKRKKLEPLDYLKWFGIFLLGAGSMFFDHQQAESNRALVEEISNIEVFKIQFSGTKTKLVTLEKKDETLEKLIRELVAETRKIIKEASKDRLYKSDYLEYKQGVEKDIDEIIADHKSTRAKVNFIEGFLKKFEQPQYSKYKKTN